MDELVALLKARGIKYTFKRHEGANPELMTLIGYYPTGQWHIVIHGKEEYSVIRGMVSYGFYEIMLIGKGKKFAEPERFETPQELIDAL